MITISCWSVWRVSREIFTITGRVLLDIFQIFLEFIMEPTINLALCKNILNLTGRSSISIQYPEFGSIGRRLLSAGDREAATI